MSNCPFLSNSRNNVLCFEECVFYECAENNGICPFTTSSKDKLLEKAAYFEYDLFKRESIDLFEDIYENKSYIKMFQVRKIV